MGGRTDSMRFPASEKDLSELLLDDENPRLPEPLQKAPQAEILRWMFENGVLEELAVSFLEHGYLDHDPLFVVEAPSGSSWVVLEGNRRLATLMVLTRHATAIEADVAFSLSEEPSSDQLALLNPVPVRIVPDRDDVREYVGFRHIGGIKEWPPEAKARWIEEEIVRRARSGAVSANIFAEIGRSVGTNAQSIRGPYLALRLLRHAKDELEDDTHDVQYVQSARFGVLVRATNSPDLRSFLAPDGPRDLRTLELIEALIAAVDLARLARVISDLVPHGGRRRAVLSDSRDVTVYARALQHPVASKALEDYGDLSLAAQILDRQDLPDRIRALERSVRVLLDELQRDLTPAPPGSIEAIRGLVAAVQSLDIQLVNRSPSQS
jgi:hypothetical protein